MPSDYIDFPLGGDPPQEPASLGIFADADPEWLPDPWQDPGDPDACSPGYEPDGPAEVAHRLVEWIALGLIYSASEQSDTLAQALPLLTISIEPDLDSLGVFQEVHVGSEVRFDVVLASRLLASDAVSVASTILHEAAHAALTYEGVHDYVDGVHLEPFAATARVLGARVKPDDDFGFVTPSLTWAARRQYRCHLDALAAVLSLLTYLEEHSNG